MSVSPVPVALPRVASAAPPGTDEEVKGYWRQWAPQMLLGVADHNRDGVLGRDEFRSSEFDRVDADRSGTLSTEELLAGLQTANADQLWTFVNNGSAASTLKQAIAEQRLKSVGVLGFSGALGAMAAALLGASVAPFVVVPAALLAGAGLVSLLAQTGKERWVGDTLGMHMDELLRGQQPADNPFAQAPGSTFGQVCEKVVDVAAAILHGPRAFFQGLKDLGELLVFLLFWCFWPRGAAQGAAQGASQPASQPTAQRLP